MGMLGCNIALIAIDLDGTLLDSTSAVSARSIRALERCKSHGVWRVVATGRSVETAKRVLPPDFPADYLIFSSGAGVCQWPSGLLIAESHLEAQSARAIAAILTSAEMSFMAHLPIPHNHLFYSHEGRYSHQTDFWQRIAAHRQDVQQLHEGEDAFAEGLAQFVVTMPHDLALFEQLAQQVAPLGSIIRATSPFDHKSLWMEIFPHGVSKGATLQSLCRRLAIEPDRVAVVGNDYNDLSMLERFKHAYVVANAPAELRGRFECLPSNDDDGVACLIEAFLPA